MRGHSLRWCLLLVLGLCCWRCLSEPIKLQVVNEWPRDVDGNPTRTDIFCSGDLQGLPAPSSATAAAALSNLCLNRAYYYDYDPAPRDVCAGFYFHSRLPYFSNSSLDAFLAGRFAGEMSYGTGLWERGVSTAPRSSEPNTPWLVADYSVSMSKSQSLGSAWKSITGTAQLDLLLCSDPNCTVLADFQNVTNGEVPGTLTLAFSGAKDLWNSAWDNVRHLATTSTASDMVQWLPQGYRASNQRPRLEAVTWLIPNASVSYSSKDAYASEIEKAIVGNTSRMAVSESDQGLSSQVGSVLPLKTVVRLNATHQQHIRVGLYKATVLLPNSLDPDPAPCATILWPDTAWMHAHGWGASLNASTCSACDTSYDLPYPGCPVYMFDTYLPREQIVQPGAGYDVSTLRLDPSGQDSSLFTNAMEDGCLPFPKCEGNKSECPHRCSVLRVGSATIAAMPLSWNFGGSTFANDFLGTLRKMYEVATSFNNTVMPWCGSEYTPSCSNSTWGQAYLPGSEAIHVPARRLMSEKGMGRYAWDIVREPTFTGIYLGVCPCTPRLVGYGCSLEADMTAGIQSIVQDAVRVLDRAVAVELATTDTSKTVGGALLDLSLTIVGLVAMASGYKGMFEWFFHRLGFLSSECSWPMCCRFSWPKQFRCSWPKRFRCSWPTWCRCSWHCLQQCAAKFLTCLVVLAALVIPPSFALWEGDRARRNNADGSSSKVGLLAADASAHSSAPYVVIGIVSVQLKADYSNIAFGLVIFNLVLAAVGGVLVCWRVCRA